MDVDRSSQQECCSSPNILEISSDEVLKIFSLVPQHERCRTIPLLCKSFANALRLSGNRYKHFSLCFFKLVFFCVLTSRPGRETSDTRGWTFNTYRTLGTAT